MESQRVEGMTRMYVPSLSIASSFGSRTRPSNSSGNGLDNSTEGDNANEEYTNENVSESQYLGFLGAP